MEYNENIRQRRKAKGWTQVELAEALGVSRQSVTRWENGWNVPTLFYAQKLADNFGISVSELMGGAESGGQPPVCSPAPPARSLAPATLLLCALSFLPVVLYAVCASLTEAVRQHMILQGFSHALSYRPVTDRIQGAGAALCIAMTALLFVWWVSKLIAGLGQADKYTRFRLYQKWRLGLVFVCCNTAVLLFDAYSLVHLPWIAKYFGGAVLALYAVWVFDLIFKRAAGERMVSERSPLLRKIHFIYLMLLSACVAVFGGMLIYYALAGGSAVGFAVYYTLVYFLCASFLIALSYPVVRLCVHCRRFEVPEE